MEEARERVVGAHRRAISPDDSSVRERLIALAFALAAMVAIVSAHVTPAQALLHRGHSFQASLETSGTNKLSEPSSVAVNELTSGKGAGDVYVLDKANNRVVRFGPNHEFLEAWGLGVKGGAEYERCKVEAECKPGVPGFGGPNKVRFDEPVAIAVDNAPGSPSAGSVYVVANRQWKKAIVYKFDPEGDLLGALLKKTEEKEELWPVVGIAIDKTGQVWLDREDEEEDFTIERFNNAIQNELIGEPEEIELPEVAPGRRPARPGFAIDALGRAYITYEPGGRDIEEEEELMEQRREERKEKKEPQIEEHFAPPCVQHECVVARFVPGEGEAILDEEAEVATFDPETNTTGIAVDTSTGKQSSGDVYLDHGGFVSAFTSDGTLIQNFGQAQLASGGGAGLAVDSATNFLYAADQKRGSVDIYEPTPAGAPLISDLSVASVTAESAKLKAKVDPNGFDTKYFFRYGTEPCSNGPSACPLLAQTTGGGSSGELEAGFGDQAIAIEADGLSASTTYHFVAIASNVVQQVESGEEGTFKTLPANTLESVLADGRAWELVSPANKRGVAIEPLAHEGGLIQAASEGTGLAFIAAAPVGDEEPAGNRAPEPTQLISTRTSPGEWATRNLTTPNAVAQGIQANQRREYQAFSPDLSLGLLFPVEPLQASETEPDATGLPPYFRDTSCGTPPCYQPLQLSSPLAGGAASPIDGATPDLKHIGFNFSPEGLLEWSAAGSNASEGTMRKVNFLPGGEEAKGEMGFGAPERALFEGARNAISQDGSLVSWSLRKNNIPHLYQSELQGSTVSTIQVDEANQEAGVGPGKAQAQPVYMTSSVKGDRVFFTDNQRLTANASWGTNELEQLEEREEAGDLYVFERSKPAGHRLTDLTPDLKLGESSDVQSGVIGASDDGSYVYFVANGVLAEAASPGHCKLEGLRSSKCNLYVVHDNGTEWEKPRLIARLSNEDGPDWGPGAKRTEYRIVEMTSHVSPNGRFLAFMSDQRLTNYNNTDVNSGQPDEEVYLYDATSGHVVCASCNPSGAQPIGVHDVQESGEGRGLLVDRIGVWSTESEETPYAHWLAGSVPGWTNLDDRESFYQSRYLSDNGRLFFNAADSLVKQDENNGKEDVYEYEPVGVGDCTSENTAGGCVALVSSGKSDHESAFLDASEGGDSVFFLTASNLVPSLDTDKAFDIYDARVCAGTAEGCPATALPPPPPCEGEECRPAPGSSPSFSSPGSANSGSGGNVTQQQVLGSTQSSPPKPKAKPLTRAQKLAAALKLCKKKYKSAKKKRAACEKQARKKYGAKKSSKSPAKKSSRARR